MSNDRRMKKVILIFVVLLCLLVISYALGKLYAYKSEPYHIAKEYLSQQDNITDIFGNDIEYFIKEYSIRHEKAEGKAVFLINLQNEKESRDVHITLHKALTWQVYKVEIE